MGDKSFADLKEALEDALAFECGERRELTVTRIKPTLPKGKTPSAVARTPHQRDRSKAHYRRAGREQNLAIRFDRSSGSKVWHSQITKTSQPSDRNFLC
jgi:hypothetical protein